MDRSNSYLGKCCTEIRDLTIVVRNWKLKPEKGRRKDLRKINSLDVDLVSTPGQENWAIFRNRKRHNRPDQLERKSARLRTN